MSSDGSCAYSSPVRSLLSSDGLVPARGTSTCSGAPCGYQGKDKLPMHPDDRPPMINRGATGARQPKNHAPDPSNAGPQFIEGLPFAGTMEQSMLSEEEVSPHQNVLVPPVGTMGQDTSFVDPRFIEGGAGQHDAGKRDVELYIRTYNTLLRSSGEISLKALVQAHYNIDSSLHPDAQSPYPDMSAFIYSVLRLPTSIIHCDLVLLGQSEQVFLQQGFHVDTWEAVTASARRRKWFYDGKSTLAVYVASVSDTDDIVPILVAFQIEWNKMYYLLNADPTTMQLLETRMDRRSPVFAEISKVLRERLHIAPDDWQRLEVIWGDLLWEKLIKIGRERKSFGLRMLGGSHVGYARATRQWWTPVENLLDKLGLRDQPVYFVSSNTHSL